MKRFYPFLLFLSFVLSGCSWKYQVFQVDSPQVEQQPGDWYIAANDDLELTYDFWSNGGVPLVTIYNKTERTITLLLEQSHFSVNQDKLSYTDANHLYENANVPDEIRLNPKEEVTLETYPVTFNWQSYGTKELSRFERSDSPFTIKNSLAYSSANQAQTLVIQNEFWVTSIKKMTKSDFKSYADLSNRKSANFFVKKPSSGIWVEVAIAAIDVLTYALINGG